MGIDNYDTSPYTGDDTGINVGMSSNNTITIHTANHVLLCTDTGAKQEHDQGDIRIFAWKIGVRLFKGLGKCRVYHFSSISLRKKAWNNGAKIFLLKWGISIKFFKKHYLRSDQPFNDLLSEPKKNLSYYIGLIKCKIAFFFHSTIS